MTIYNVSAQEALWEICKPLLAFSDDLSLYKEVMDEDKDSTPDSFLVLRATTSRPHAFGDGDAKIYVDECDLMLQTKSKGNTLNDLHVLNSARVEQCLNSQDIPFFGTNLGYDESQKVSRYTWSINVYHE